MAGVLHFANYYRFMEEVEHAFWRSVELSVMSHDGGRALGWPRVATRCEHFAPVRFEEEVELVLRVASVSDRSVSYDIEFRSEDRRIALGRITAVCCAMGDRGFQPVSIPPAFRKRLDELQSDA